MEPLRYSDSIYGCVVDVLTLLKWHTLALADVYQREGRRVRERKWIHVLLTPWGGTDNVDVYKHTIEISHTTISSVGLCNI